MLDFDALSCMHLTWLPLLTLPSLPHDMHTTQQGKDFGLSNIRGDYFFHSIILLEIISLTLLFWRSRYFSCVDLTSLTLDYF